MLNIPLYMLFVLGKELETESLYFPEKGCHLGTNRSDNET